MGFDILDWKVEDASGVSDLELGTHVLDITPSILMIPPSSSQEAH